MTQDVNVFLLNMDNNEVVTHNEDDSYSIFINARLSNDGQLKAYEHAMRHIKNQDFQKEDVQAIETSAHSIAVPENTKPIPAEKYKEQIERIRRSRKRIQRLMKKDEERVKFIQEYMDVFALCEHQKLYGDDL